jgi:hypothetical protein
MADAPHFGAEEKIGHSGRDDKAKEEKSKSTARNHPAKNAGWDGGGCAT